MKMNLPVICTVLLFGLPSMLCASQSFKRIEYAAGVADKDWTFMTAWDLSSGSLQVSPAWFDGDSVWHYDQPYYQHWVAKWIYDQGLGQTRELQWSYTQSHQQPASTSILGEWAGYSGNGTFETYDFAPDGTVRYTRSGADQMTGTFTYTYDEGTGAYSIVATGPTMTVRMTGVISNRTTTLTTWHPVLGQAASTLLHRQ